MKHVIIVGAGFAGPRAAKNLGNARDIKVTVIDKTNHHLFQPLLYQVVPPHMTNRKGARISLNNWWKFLIINYHSGESVFNPSRLDKPPKKEISMKLKGIVLSLTVMGVLLIFTACAKDHMKMKKNAKPFGSETEISYARDLWRVLVKEKLAGPERIRAIPYEGMEPHGVILEQLSTPIKVNAHRGMVHVKSNYMGKGVSRSKVVNDPDTYLKAITVMFKREKGYDPENQDWFWAKYKQDGTLHANPKGVLLAGRVAKGMSMGCIACHRSADGGDYLFNNTSTQLD